MNKEPIIIIPARMGSTRLPGKMMLAETGKPLIVHTWLNAKKAGYGVWVATDSREIGDACDGALIPEVHVHASIMTSPYLPNGTARAAAAYRKRFSVLDDSTTVVIVQGDEPEIAPELINAVIHRMETDEDIDCATAAYMVPPRQADAFHNDLSKVKVFLDATGRVASGFARKDSSSYCFHIGIYAYRARYLVDYAVAGPCQQEVDESLEQLRALELGMTMGVVLWNYVHHPGIDTRADYDAFAKRWKEQHG